MKAVQVRTLARYNSWQNRSLYASAASLDDAARRLDRGAFFGSIHRTLCHLMWGDENWMSRFADTPKPPGNLNGGADWIADFAELHAERVRFDAIIEAWANAVTDDWLAGDLTWYSGLLKSELTRPRWFVVTHFFNHQTHHRGQAHSLLTQAKAPVEPQETDFMIMPQWD